MKQTGYQRPEKYDNDGNIIQTGTYGSNTPFVDGKGHGSLDYINNNLEFLYALSQGAFVFVDSKEKLPKTGQPDKFYITNNDGKTYIWDDETNTYQERTVSVNGLSAYEIAKKYGFPGTETEWLDGQLNRDIVGPSPANMAQAHIIICAGPKDMAERPY